LRYSADAAGVVTTDAKLTFERTVGNMEIPGRGDFGELMVAAALRSEQ
jgi:hypothetical protein